MKDVIIRGERWGMPKEGRGGGGCNLGASYIFMKYSLKENKKCNILSEVYNIFTHFDR